MEEKKTNGLAIASLVLGIVGIVCIFAGKGWLSLILGIIGIILAVKSKKQSPSGMATAGLVLSIISTVFGALVFIACTALVGVGASIFSSMAGSL